MSSQRLVGYLRQDALTQALWTIVFLTASMLLGMFIGWGTVNLSPFTTIFLLAATAGSIAVTISPGLALISLLAIVWLIPFGTLPFHVGFRFSFLDLITGILLLLFAWQICTHRLRIPTRAVVITVTLYAVLLLLAAVNGLRFGVTEDAITYSIKLASSVLLFVMLATWLQTPSIIRRTAIWLLVFAAVQALIGIILYFLSPGLSIRLLSWLGRFGYPVGEGVLRYIADTPLLRATGTSVDPNLLGGALVFAIALALSLWASQPRRWWLLGIITIFLICLLLTRSRAALLGSGVAVIALTMLRYRLLLWLYPVGGIALVAVPQTRAMLSHLISGLLAQDRAAAMRLDEYSKSLKLIQEHPWLGVGFGPPPSVDTFVGVSNIYLQLAEFGGLLTLAAFSLAIGTVYWSMWRGWRNGVAPEIEWLVVGAMASLTGSLVTGLFDHYYVDIPHMATLFWLVAALGISTAWTQRDSHRATKVSSGCYD